ncbi:CorA metal ion transporter [Mycoemilia scoparia]|uniref:CorA metal ion transporter n=1 Tax=Mycoemilia scoparia TaxID=417184 RepID=A0A9W7ZZX0_9FUNG|nr:CorA metal ion transporter [Mycoemilia scoparia]
MSDRDSFSFSHSDHTELLNNLKLFPCTSPEQLEKSPYKPKRTTIKWSPEMNPSSTSDNISHRQIPHCVQRNLTPKYSSSPSTFTQPAGPARIKFGNDSTSGNSPSKVNWDALRNWVQRDITTTSSTNIHSYTPTLRFKSKESAFCEPERPFTSYLLRHSHEIPDWNVMPKGRLTLFLPGHPVFRANSLGHFNVGSTNFLTLLKNLREADNDESKGGMSNIKSQPNDLFWLDISDPDPEELESLAGIFDIHPLTIENILYDPPSTDKYEKFKNYDFISYRMITSGTKSFANDSAISKSSTFVNNTNYEPTIKAKMSNHTNTNGISTHDKGSCPIASPSILNTITNKLEKMRKSLFHRKTKEEYKDFADYFFNSPPSSSSTSTSSPYSTSSFVGNKQPRSLLTLPRYIKYHITADIPGTKAQATKRAKNIQKEFETNTLPFDLAIQSIQDQKQHDNTKSTPLFIIILPTGIITCHHSHHPQHRFKDNSHSDSGGIDVMVRSSMARLSFECKEKVHINPYYISYCIIDEIVNTMLPICHEMELESERIDHLVLVLHGTDDDDNNNNNNKKKAQLLDRINDQRRQVLWFMGLLGGKKDVVKQLERQIKDIANKLASKISTKDTHRYHHNINDQAGRDEEVVDTDSDEHSNGKDIISGYESSNTTENGQTSPRFDVGDYEYEVSDNPEMENSSNIEATYSLTSILQSEQEKTPLKTTTTTNSFSKLDNIQVPGQIDSDNEDNILSSLKSWADLSRFLNDIHDHIHVMTTSVQQSESVLSRSNVDYMSRISLEITQSSEEGNRLMNRLTSVNVLFMPLYLVVGIWSMKVYVPGQADKGIADFLLMNGAMAVYSMIFVYFMWKYDF